MPRYVGRHGSNGAKVRSTSLDSTKVNPNGMSTKSTTLPLTLTPRLTNAHDAQHVGELSYVANTMTEAVLDIMIYDCTVHGQV